MVEGDGALTISRGSRLRRLWRIRSVEPIKKANISDSKSQSATPPKHLDTDRALGEAASIAEICAAITKLVDAVSEVGGETDPQTGFPRITGDCADTLWQNVSEFAAQLARARSSSFDDISGKISIWRHLAPEQNLTDKFATIDETLLHSIIGDVERLHAEQS